jgi:hypothetical protein
MGLLGATLMIPVALCEQRRYHDAKHNDDHEWNEHENQAYRMWVQERRRKYDDFSKLKDRDAYWDWRHNHSDAVLRLDVR